MEILVVEQHQLRPSRRPSQRPSLLPTCPACGRLCGPLGSDVDMAAVLDCTELLEAVLAHVPPSSLPACAAVSSAWRTAVKGIRERRERAARAAERAQVERETARIQIPGFPLIVARMCWRDHPRYGMVFEGGFGLEELARMLAPLQVGARRVAV